MSNQARGIMVLIVTLATIGLAGCDHYNCSTGLTFGGSTCSSSSISNPGSSSGSGSATAAFAFVVDTGTSTGGTIDGYTLNTSANTFQATTSYKAPTIPADDFGAGMVVAQSQYLYAGFGSTGQIFSWSIDATGNLTAIGSPLSAPYMSFVGAGLGSISMITNPTGTLLFVADTFEQRIYVYTIGTGGVLSAATPASVSLSYDPVNMTTDGLGKYLYVTALNLSNTHTGTEVWAYTITSATGALAQIAGSPFKGTNYNMWQVQGEPTGKYLIGTTGETKAVTGADDDHLYVFSIAQTGTAPGAISLVGSPVSTQFSPFSIAVQSQTNGNLIYSFGIDDTALGFNPPEGYAISDSSGALTADSGSPFSNAALGTWGQFDQSGAFLFLLGAVTDQSTNVTTYQLSAFAVGTGGALTQPSSTLTLPSGGVWAVTDPK